MTTVSAVSTMSAAAAFMKKDVRQNLVALCALLAVVVVINTIAAYFQWSFNNGYTNLDAIINVFFLPVTQITISVTVTCIGFLLGLAQVRGDNSLDMWAFLVHRPASRSALFLGRLAAGMVLYIAVAGIPLALFTIYAASSYAGGFFYWKFTLPSVADFLCGFVYYLAGLLVAQSSAPLIGPRVLPVIVALSCSFFIRVLVDSFSGACLLIGVYALVLGVAAMGSFCSQGFRIRAPRLTVAARLVFVCVSFMLMLHIPQEIANGYVARAHLAILDAAWHRELPFVPMPARTLTVRRFIGDGTVVKEITSAPAVTTRPAKTNVFSEGRRYETLDGQPLPQLTRDAVEADAEACASVSLALQTSLPTGPTDYRNLDRIAWVTNVSHQEDEKHYTEERWFYLTDQRRFYIYSRKGDIFRGTFGQNGFVPPGNLAEPFAAAKVSTYEPIVTPHAIFTIEPYRYAISTLLAAPPGEVLQELTYVGYGIVAVVTDKHILLFGTYRDARRTDMGRLVAGEKPLVVLPLNHPISQFTTGLTFLPKLRRWAIWYRHLQQTDHPPADGNIVELYDEGGQLIRETKFDRAVHVDPPLVAREDPRSTELMEIMGRWQVYSGMVDGATDPVFSLLYTRSMNHLRSRDGTIYRSEADAPRFLAYRRLWVSLLVSAVIAAAGLLVVRRYNYSFVRALPWVLAMVVLGIPALLTFVATHAYPRRSRCGSCGKGRPLAMEACPHCGAAWPAPPATGTEIVVS